MIHYENKQLYLRLGLKIKVNQSQWLKTYVKKKCVRNRIDVKLVTNKKDYLKRTSKLSYMSHKIFDNDLFVTGIKKVTLTLNKPAYTGMCILELIKVLMYEFHYDYIKNKYGNNSKL